MGMPSINNVTREQAINNIITAVALEKASLGNILNAEGEKINAALSRCFNLEISNDNQLQQYDFVYQGNIAYTGLAEQGYSFVVFKLYDAATNTTTDVYCFDVNTFIVAGDHYEQEILQGSMDISQLNANRVRNILLNAFPYISLTALRTLSGIPSLTQQEAVTGTQLAIWRLTNNFTLNHSNPNVMTLYNWYLLLPPVGIVIDPAEITLTAVAVPSENTCGVMFSFSTNGTNADGSSIPLSFVFDRDIEALYGAIVTVSTVGGITNVTVTNLPIGVAFAILIKGVQTLPEDAYRYVNAQDLVGLFLQTNFMTAQGDYECLSACNFDINDILDSVNHMVKTIVLLEIVLGSNLDLFEDCL